MKTAEISLYLDALRPKRNGKCSVKIKVTFNRKRKYYSTGIDIEPDEFERVMNNKRRTPEQKDIYLKLNYFYNKGLKALEAIKIFTFDSFEDVFLDQRNVQDSVSFAFDKYIEQLISEKRIETATSYQSTKQSLEKFKKNLTFAEITTEFLRKYEAWMKDKNKSVSTIGIYLRSLRSIYNQQKIDRSLYPFGESKNKYSIPASRNIKKALTVEEIAKLYHYPAAPGSSKEMAKDYWIFLYLCNGMNIKDFCLLQWSNIDGQTLNYNRAKTNRSKKESKPISVALKPETWAIIKKWGRPSIAKDSYIFPHLQKGLSAEKEQLIFRNITKLVNKHMKEIVSELGINKNVTTYFARHSFATVLKRSGAKIEMISELLGHSSVNVTESYLDSFEMEQIQKETDVLTAVFKMAN